MGDWLQAETCIQKCGKTTAVKDMVTVDHLQELVIALSNGTIADPYDVSLMCVTDNRQTTLVQTDKNFKNTKAQVHAIVLLTWVRLEIRNLFYNFGSGSWLAWATDIAAHYAAIHSLHWQTTGHAVCSQQTYHRPQSDTLSLQTRKLLLIFHPAEWRQKAELS